MIIDCDTCAVRHVACHDCVVGVLLGTPAVPSAGPTADGPADREPAGPGDPLPAGFGPVERRALEVLADQGLIPRLRLVPPSPRDAAQDAPVEQRGSRRRRSAG